MSKYPIFSSGPQLWTTSEDCVFGRATLARTLAPTRVEFAPNLRTQGSQQRILAVHLDLMRQHWLRLLKRQQSISTASELALKFARKSRRQMSNPQALQVTISHLQRGTFSSAAEVWTLPSALCLTLCQLVEQIAIMVRGLFGI